MILDSRYSLTTEINRQKRLSDQIAQLQTDISSGIKVHVSSDDPVAARRIAQIRATQASQTVYASNVTTATQIASQVEDNLNDVQTSLTRVKELMLQANSGTASAADRTAIATELQTIADTVATAAQATDASGAPIYTQGTNPIAIPVGHGVNIAAAASYDQTFGSVTLANGTTSSVADILATAITALKANDTTGIATAITSTDAAQTHIATALTDAGGRAERIQAASDRLDSSKLDLADERSGLEDTDVTEASANLLQKKTMLDAAQAILAQLSKTTLFDRLS